MADYTDQTHDPKLTSWVESANDPNTDFPIQNLPYGSFKRTDLGDDNFAHIGVAIGDQIFDITQAIEDRVLTIDDELIPDFYFGYLNEFMRCNHQQWTSVRVSISTLLQQDNAALRDNHELRKKIIVPMDSVHMQMPAIIGDYTDFYASLSHATNVGTMFRPDNPLLPNYKHLPVGYHGRASSIVIDGTPIRRPHGQLHPDDNAPPIHGPVRLLDYEMEVGVFIGQGNAMGEPVPMTRATDNIFGLTLLNDWSARDVQKWEYQPLGPFNAKNFATSISPWVVTLDALAPFREQGPARSADDPQVLPYLQPTDDMQLNITVEVSIRSQQMREKDMPAHVISQANFREMYWTIAQMLVHHTSTGCNMQPGDLIASGTVSGPEEFNRGCLLERTWRGQNPIDLPDGTQRKFLQDGDELIMRGWCERDGFRRIGFGECRGIIQPAK